MRIPAIVNFQLSIFNLYLSSILIRIGSSALLSISSLIVILFRVSPFSSPAIAVPLFFLTLFLSIACTATLMIYAAWLTLSIEGMDTGRKITISLREGFFLASAICLLFLFQILSILTWWIGVLIILIFVLVEMALQS